MKHILFCTKCKRFTLEKQCCGENTITIKPPKYSPEDKYGSYRREAKRKVFEQKGML